MTDGVCVALDVRDELGVPDELGVCDASCEGVTVGDGVIVIVLLSVPERDGLPLFEGVSVEVCERVAAADGDCDGDAVALTGVVDCEGVVC